ncbi:DNA recombination protein RmuC, partial [Sutterella parvirubra]
MVNDGMLWGAVLLLLVANLFLAAWLLKRISDRDDPEEARAQAETVVDAVLEGVMESRRDLEQSIAQSDARVTQGMANLSAFVSREQHRSGEAVQALTVEARNELKGMNERLGKEFLALHTMVNDRLVKLVETNAGAADALNKKLATELESMRRQNDEKLEAMRATVQEKLDKTLNERLEQSFRVVDEKLGLVENGLGEMRRMAESVTRLQNVLANVKTRGTFGETQLEAILSTMLGPSQYVSQAKLFADANVIVDFAVRLPG